MGKERKGETFAERVNRQVREARGARTELSTPEENRKMNAWIRGEKASDEGEIGAEEFFGSEGDRED